MEHYFSDDNTLNVRCTNCITSFDMAIDLELGGIKIQVFPTTKWSGWKVEKQAEIRVNEGYYEGSFQLNVGLILKL